MSILPDDYQPPDRPSSGPPDPEPSPAPESAKPKRKGRAGHVTKTDRSSPAEFHEGAPATPPNPADSAAAGDPILPPQTGEQLLEAARLREIANAQSKLQAGLRLTKAESALLKRTYAEAHAVDPGKLAQLISRVCEDIDVWWVNGAGSTFQVRNGGSLWLEVPREDLCTILHQRGIRPGRPGDPESSTDKQAIAYIMQERSLDRSIEGLAGFRAGIHEFKGRRVLVRKGPRILTPEPGEWPTIEALLIGLLGIGEPSVPAERGSLVQYERFTYWLARAASNVLHAPSVTLNSQVLMLAGPAGAGKSLIQHLILTPLLGGRSADPSRYLFGETTFNEGWMSSEHLLIEDPRPNIRTHERLGFAQMLKSLTVNQEHSLHAKNKAEFGVPCRFVVSISINDDPDSLRILPKLTPDFADKVMLFRVRHHPLPMPTRTAVEREAFSAAIRAELPAFLHYLLQHEPPPSLHSSRFGVLHYHNPELILDMGDDTPEGELLNLLDHCKIKGESLVSSDKELWECEGGYAPEECPRLTLKPAARKLLDACVQERKRIWVGTALMLQDLMERVVNQRAWKKIADHNQLTRLLSRLAEDKPDRVAAWRTSSQRGWMIAAPRPADEEPDAF